MKLAVMGHYDSRGGTTGMPLPDNPKVDDVMKALIRYQQDLFMWHPGQWSPGIDDFLFVADLSVDDECTEWPDGDLEEAGIVIELEPDGHHCVEAPIDEEGRFPGHQWFDFDIEVDKCIKEPVKLKFVPFTPELKAAHDSPNLNDSGYFDKLPKWEAEVLAANPGYTHPSWNDDAFSFIIGTGM